MLTRRPLLRGVLASASAASALLLSGCASSPRTRIYFSNTTINHHPARVTLDTGASGTSLTDLGAEKLDVRIPSNLANVRVNGQQDANALALSDPVDVFIQGQDFTAQLPILTSAWYKREATDSLSTDAFIGWPEVQNNILVFNGTNRTVTAVAEQPPASISWPSFNLHPSAQLFLDVPLPDGNVGTVLIDTGQPFGVSLPASQWKAWRAAHPHAPTVSRFYTLPNSTEQSAEEAWADEITLGAITLTDVPVHQADAVESFGTQNYLGTLGLYGLSRVDLIVNGKYHLAYLRPKPPPGPPYPGFSRPTDDALAAESGSWSVADNVKIKLDYIYFQAGYLAFRAGDYTTALVNLNHAIDLNRGNLDAVIARGLAKIALGDLDGAIADYTALLVLQPQNTEALFYRAIAQQLHGDFLSAELDYSLVTQLRPDGSESAYLNRAILARQLGSPAPDFSQTVADWKPSWPKTVGQFLAGQLTQAQLLAAAAQGDDTIVPIQQAMALYFAGMVQYLDHDPAAARAFWQKCLAVPVGGFSEYQAFARADLARLDAPAQK
jgi:hypothetical protein